jgi:hypothetical protein
MAQEIQLYRPHLQISRNPNLSAPSSKLKKSKSIGTIFKAQEIQIYRPNFQSSRNPNLSIPFSNLKNPNLSVPFFRLKKTKSICPIFKAQEIQTYRSHLRGQEIQILTFEDWTDMLFRNVGKELRLHNA